MDIEEVITIIRAEAKRLSSGYSSLDPEDIEQDSLMEYLTFGNRSGVTSAEIRKIVLDVTNRHLSDVIQRSVPPAFTPKMVRDALRATRWDDVRIDIKNAIQVIPPGDRKIILDSYGSGNMPANETSARKRLNRAVDKLTMQMNIGSSGRRKAISNAQARAAISGG